MAESTCSGPVLLPVSSPLPAFVQSPRGSEPEAAQRPQRRLAFRTCCRTEIQPVGRYRRRRRLCPSAHHTLSRRLIRTDCPADTGGSSWHSPRAGRGSGSPTIACGAGRVKQGGLQLSGAHDLTAPNGRPGWNRHRGGGDDLGGGCRTPGRGAHLHGPAPPPVKLLKIEYGNVGVGIVVHRERVGRGHRLQGGGVRGCRTSR